MQIEFPDLKSNGCRHLLVCAQVTNPDAELAKWLAEDRVFVAKYMKEGAAHFVRLMTGQKKKDHFHIEVAVKGYFAVGRSPKTNHKMAEIRQLCEKVTDCIMDVSCQCSFNPQFSDLPERGIIKGFSVETTVGAVGMRLNSGVLLITGAPIQRVGWTRSLKSETCTVTLDAAFAEAFSDTYLTGIFGKMRSFFLVNVLGKVKEPDAKF